MTKYYKVEWTLDKDKPWTSRQYSTHKTEEKALIEVDWVIVVAGKRASNFKLLEVKEKRIELKHIPEKLRG